MLCIMVLLIRCSSLFYVSLTPLTSSKNLTRPAPEAGESRDDLCLPFYTSGFE